MAYSVLLVTLLSWVATWYTTTSQDRDTSFLLITSLWQQNTYCITNGSSALAFIPPLESADSAVSAFYPNRNSISCELKQDDSCYQDWVSEKWMLQNSITGNVSQLMTDWRWEELPIFKTSSGCGKRNGKKIDDYEILDHPPISVNKDNFRISFSTRTKSEIHIFLCDKRKIIESECHCVVLEKQKYTLKMCHANYDKETFKDFCGKILRTGQLADKLLGEEKWSHFQITIKNNTLTISNNRGPIFTYTSNTYFPPKYILFGGKCGKTLLKIHNYTYAYCESETRQKLGSSEIDIQEGVNCISMFILTCEKCYLIFELEASTTCKLDTSVFGPFNTQDEKWTEIKLFVEIVKGCRVKMYVSTRAETLSGMFWAIDHIRGCSREEYRYLKFSGRNWPCQLINSGDTRDVITEDVQRVDETGLHCPEDTFGSNCIPCSIFGAGNIYCPNFKYCEKVGKSGEACRCTSGYTDKNCGSVCPENQYGHGCKNNCPQKCDTSHSCRYTDGMCQNCLDQYQGEKCDIGPEGVLLEPPKVTAEETTTCTVRVNNLSRNKNSSKLPEYIKIQYKEGLKGVTWKDVNKYKFFTAPDTIIENLKPDTEYYIRAVLYSGEPHVYTSDNDKIKYSKCRTTCNEVGSILDDIQIVPKHNSATVSFKLKESSCDIHKYKLWINGYLRGYISTNPLKILSIDANKIEPCMTYALSIFRIGSSQNPKKIFTTTVGVAYPITKVTVSKESTNAVLLEWETKTYSCGKTHFRIQYWRKKGKLCQNYTRLGPENPTMAYETTEMKYYLSNLQPYSVYQVEIVGITSTGSSPKYTREVETLPTGKLSEDELLNHSVGIRATSTTIVFFVDILCDRIQGGITMTITARCVTDWCSNHTVHSITYQYGIGGSTEYVLRDLSPYVNYTVRVDVKRTKGDNTSRALLLPNRAREYTVQTEPAVPANVKDVLAFSKDENFISLRWKPPYPPTGILKGYRITYTNLKTGEAFHTDEVAPLRCKVWLDYHCATIEKNIVPKNMYSLQISATNEVPSQYVPIHQLKLEVSAAPGTPDPPINVSSFWTNKEAWNVTWTHPNVTNGIIKTFRITVDCAGRVKELEMNITDEESYNMTYTYQINENELGDEAFWCSRCILNVRTVNRVYVSSSSTSNFYAPPPNPNTTIKGKLDGERTNSTITVYIPELERRTDAKMAPNTTTYLLISRLVDGRVFRKLQEFEEAIRNSLTPTSTDNLKLLFKRDGNELPDVVYMGDFSTNRNYYNFHVEAEEEYGIHLFYVNKCNNIVRIYRMDTGKLAANKKKSNSGSVLYSLLLLLLLVPLAVYIYLKRGKGTGERSAHCLRKSCSHSDIIPLAEKTPPVISKNPKLQIYENSRFIPKTVHSKPIRLAEYESYVRNTMQEGELERQHGLFPGGQTKPWDYGASAPNKSKNRYKNLIAYDHTRVKLTKTPGDEYSDYINASFIDGYKSPKSYIATQGPKSSTLNDFWRMIWQYKVEHIVMLANIYEGGKKKVEQYWPDFNDEKDFGGIKVQFINSKVFADYEYRVFNVTNENEQRKVEQIHFTSWPDHGIPLYPQSLVPFVQRMLKIAHSANHPVLVHCSAGVGRTGTIILSDICLRMAASEGCVDFLANLELLRNHRPKMVDNIEQYKLAHLVVLECLFGMNSSIDCDEKMQIVVDSLIASGGVQKYMRYLEDTQWEDAAMDTVWDVEEEAPINPDKNRFKHIVPAPYHRVFLLRYPPEDETSSYINAIVVDGFRSPGRYIVTQQPMPNTLGDFWRLVNEQKCRVVISLNGIDTRDATSCQFLPKIGGAIRPVDYLTVRHVNTTVRDVFNRVNVQVIDENEDEEMTVAVISMRNWMPGDVLPESIQDFLTFWEESYIISRKASPVLVSCYDGATASGLYIAMSFIIEKMKLEHVCDVCLAVRNIRHNRRQFVTTEEQFEFLYKASLLYIKGFEPYANFT